MGLLSSTWFRTFNLNLSLFIDSSGGVTPQLTFKCVKTLLLPGVKPEFYLDLCFSLIKRTGGSLNCKRDHLPHKNVRQIPKALYIKLRTSVYNRQVIKVSKQRMTQSHLIFKHVTLETKWCRKVAWKDNSGRKTGSCHKFWTSDKQEVLKAWCENPVVKIKRQTQVWKICNVISTNKFNTASSYSLL